jgi:hypothetical protein
LVDDGAGADGGVVVAADLAELSTIRVFQGDAADGGVDAAAEQGGTVLGDAALLIVGVGDLAGDLADGVDIERVDFGFEQVGAGNAVGGDGGAVLPSGDLISGIGVGDDEAGEAAVGGVGVDSDAGGDSSLGE